MNRDVKAVVPRALHQGWRVELRRAGHLVFRAPSAGTPLIFTGSTPSDVRSTRNLVAKLKRHGFRPDQ